MGFQGRHSRVLGRERLPKEQRLLNLQPHPSGKTVRDSLGGSWKMGGLGAWGLGLAAYEAAAATYWSKIRPP